MSQASMTTVGLCRALMAQPTIRREYRSRTTATSSHPARVGTTVKSAAHTRFFVATVHCWFRRFGIGGASCWRCWTVRIYRCRCHAMSQASQPGHPMAATRFAHPLQEPPHSPRAVGLACLLVQHPHPLDQEAIALSAHTVGAPLPGRDPTATDLQHPTQTGHAMLVGMDLNERVLHRDSLAKYAAAFFKLSRSSVTRASSRFSRTISVIRSFRAPEPGTPQGRGPAVPSATCTADDERCPVRGQSRRQGDSHSLPIAPLHG